jgi:hypothetical protein
MFWAFFMYFETGAGRQSALRWFYFPFCCNPFLAAKASAMESCHQDTKPE